MEEVISMSSFLMLRYMALYLSVTIALYRYHT